MRRMRVLAFIVVSICCHASVVSYSVEKFRTPRTGEPFPYVKNSTKVVADNCRNNLCARAFRLPPNSRPQLRFCST